jgi:hypothetical protein
MKEEQESLLKQKQEIAAEKLALEAQHKEYMKMVEDQNKKAAVEEAKRISKEA